MVFDRAERASCADGKGDGGHRYVIGRLPQIPTVMLAKGVPEPMELSADGFDIRTCRLTAIFRVFDHSRSRLGRVAEAREIHGHGQPPSVTITQLTPGPQRTRVISNVRDRLANSSNLAALDGSLRVIADCSQHLGQC